MEMQYGLNQKFSLSSFPGTLTSTYAQNQVHVGWSASGFLPIYSISD